ncbi:MAG: hypothetical protein ABF567_12025, partial [Acetobacter okinawensis]
AASDVYKSPGLWGCWRGAGHRGRAAALGMQRGGLAQQQNGQHNAGQVQLVLHNGTDVAA